MASTNVLGTDVPAADDNIENCHDFVFRWLVSAGIYKGDLPSIKTTGNIISNPTMAKTILWPHLGSKAREGGVLKATSGDIIGVFDSGFNIQHSMIALNPNEWIGANNAKSFGLPNGRRKVDVSGALNGCGWVGNDNVFKTVSGDTLTVFCQKPIVKEFPKGSLAALGLRVPGMV